MSETMLGIDERLLFDPAMFDVESLGGLDGGELAELFQRSKPCDEVPKGRWRRWSVRCVSVVCTAVMGTAV